MNTVQQLTTIMRNQCKAIMELLDTSNPNSDEYNMFITSKQVFDELVDKPTQCNWALEYKYMEHWYTSLSDKAKDKIAYHYQLFCKASLELEKMIPPTVKPNLTEQEKKQLYQDLEKRFLDERKRIYQRQIPHKAPKDNPL